MGDRLNLHEGAACQHSDPSLFFPDRGMPVRDVYGEARRLCRGCPVRIPCLDYAIRNEQSGFRSGMFGGLTPDQRDRVARLFGWRKQPMELH